ncbi:MULTISPECIES: hypothetical protein [Okeania]|uniref:Bulb-type lectin domain-containing protein n=1 Tax=Okeania hirsuta TaxID=1458930 RepID=A0A3N6PJT7_9CYAN|nr:MULTISPECIES: hypothetical protein [Okeania]NEP71365.1 hypothetical protein [Okeania sp. SIO2G5]NEP92577.1 hypothetical protein [Okeania sp. SIO2F5]NEQ90129.1 hypothetical protein [Okeania sp. SIO2G4]NES74653.1 hypothetical protein [Okeania sp. SIO1H4]NET21940.1 hypothetical protein [Okeania sp. SIO1H5]
MGRWGDESIFLPAREATRFAIGRRGVSSAFSPFSFLNFHNFLRLRTEAKSTYRVQRYAQGFYNPSRQSVWATNTHDQGARVLAMQADGNLVIYADGGRVLWASNTHGNPGAFLAIQQDGNVVVYTNRGVPLWSTGTNGR